VPGPELATVIEMLRGNPPVGGDDIHAMRAREEAMTGIMPLPEDVTYDPVDAGGVAARW
jgi:hypothetical protein